jgi:hypothetical protein
MLGFGGAAFGHSDGGSNASSGIASCSESAGGGGGPPADDGPRTVNRMLPNLRGLFLSAEDYKNFVLKICAWAVHRMRRGD